MMMLSNSMKGSDMWKLEDILTTSIYLLKVRHKNSESGQVLLIGAFIILALSLMAISVANVGMMVAEKIHLQDTVDASAYSAAVHQARYMNLNAYINRAMVANYDSMAFNTALWATVASHDHGSAVVTSILYQVTALIEVLSIGIATGIAVDLDQLADVFRDYVHSPLHDFNQNLDDMFAQDDGKQDLNQYLEKYNTDFLSMYQGLLYAAAQSARHDVIKEVAAKMDKRIVMTSVLSMGAETVSYDELERAVDYVVASQNEREGITNTLSSRFDSLSGEEDYDDKVYLLGAITESSLDSFTAGRDRAGNINLIRQFDPIRDLIEDIVRPVEIVLEGACETLTLTLADCDTHINLNLGSVLREGQEDSAEQSHVPIIATQRMREVNGWIFDLDIEGFPGVSDILNFFLGSHGYTAGDRRNDVANAANMTVSTDKGIPSLYRMQQCLRTGAFTVNPLQMPTRGLNVLNMFLASEMLIEFPLFCDEHWDGSYDSKPVDFFQIFPPGTGQLEGAAYVAEVYSNWKTEDGVPNYDWQTNLEDVGFANYHYPTDGADLRPNGTSGGAWENYLSGPSIAVIGVMSSRKMKGLKGLGIGNEYSMSAISRAQVYYTRNPNRPFERPSLFNPYWLARLAPINSEDTPVLLRYGLPYVASMGLEVRPTH